MITLDEARFIVGVLEGLVSDWTGDFLSPGMLSEKGKIFVRYGEIYSKDPSIWSDEAIREARAEWLYRYLGGAE